MNVMNLIADMKEDADLLTRSDEWLEMERKSKAIAFDKIVKELGVILLAQRIKMLLQQKNLVAVQQIIKDANGKIEDIIIRILNLPDAIMMLSGPQDEIEEINATTQLKVWDMDGYDLQTASNLRK